MSGSQWMRQTARVFVCCTRSMGSTPFQSSGPKPATSMCARYVAVAPPPIGSRTRVVRVYRARLPGAASTNDIAVSARSAGGASNSAAIALALLWLQARRNRSTWRVGNGGSFDESFRCVRKKTPAPSASTTTSTTSVRHRQKRRGLSVNVSPTGPYCARAGQPASCHRTRAGHGGVAAYSAAPVAHFGCESDHVYSGTRSTKTWRADVRRHVQGAGGAARRAARLLRRAPDAGGRRRHPKGRRRRPEVEG